MNKNLPFSLNRTAGKILLGCALAFGTATFARAQGMIPTGTIGSSGAGPYSYNLTFTDGASATTAIGSIWYAWIPGAFYLPNMPVSASAPSGWTATVSGNSVQYVANSSANYINPGQSLSGFGYQATFTPAQLAAAPNSGVSVAYATGLFSSPSSQFTVQVVPEPSEPMLMLSGATMLWFTRRRFVRSV